MLEAGWDLRLLGFWQLRLDSRTVTVGPRQQRLIAALAVLGPRSRRMLAGLLWPESSEDQAADSVRVSIFHIFHDLPGLLADSRDPLALKEEVEIDFGRVSRLIGEIDRPGFVPPGDATEIIRNAELLPGWYEEWVLYEQERLQHQRMAALEALAAHYLSWGSLFRAQEAARIAVSIEPLRESAQLILIQCYLAADDRASALLVYRDFRALLEGELGVAPSPRFAELLNCTATAERTGSAPAARGTALLRPSPGSFHDK